MADTNRPQNATGNGTGAPTVADIMDRLNEVDDAVAAVHDAVVAYDEAQQDAGPGRRQRGSSSNAATSGNGNAGPTAGKPNGTAEAARRFGAGQ